jgi:hypothetical protein
LLRICESSRRIASVVFSRSAVLLGLGGEAGAAQFAEFGVPLRALGRELGPVAVLNLFHLARLLHI